MLVNADALARYAALALGASPLLAIGGATLVGVGWACRAGGVRGARRWQRVGQLVTSAALVDAVAALAVLVVWAYATMRLPGGGAG